jgi:subtilisin family serine protease
MAASGDRLVAAWVDRRDFNLTGYNVYAARRGRRPDLQPFTPEGWESPLVATMTEGAREDGILAEGYPVYVSLALVNAGLADALGPVEATLLVDGQLVGSWEVPGGLPQATFASVEDHPLSLDAGAHTLTLRLDPADRIVEGDEDDNELLKDVWVVTGEPQLILDPPSLWFDAPAPAPPQPITRSAGQSPTIAPRLAVALGRAAVGDRLRVVIAPAERLDPTWLRSLGRRGAMAALRDHAEAQRARLASRTGAALRSLWLSGELVGELTAAEVATLAADPAVGLLWLDDRRSELRGQAPAPELDHVSLGGPSRAPWPLELLKVPEAWGQGLDGGGILIGHTDSGVAWDHPDLVGHLWDGRPEYPHHGYDFLDEDDDPYDPGEGNFWHGTHTGGLVVSRSHGAAPGARLVVTRCVPGYYEDLVEALQFCLDQGCRVISTSAGWTLPSDALRSANRTNAEVLLALDVAWIVAAGNGDNQGGHVALPDDIGSPGDAPHPVHGTVGHAGVITVGALTQWQQVWPSSSRGPAHWDIAGDAGHDDYPYPPGLDKPDVAAPGADIVSTVGYGGYDTYSGTSMAAPLVAGCAAILLQANPTLTVAALAAALEATASDLAAPGRDLDTGAGLVDLPAALAALPANQGASVQVRNGGGVPLVIDAITASAPWLAVSPASGAVAPGDSLRMTVTWDAGGLAEGAYHGSVALTSNDPRGTVTLPVTLQVGSPVAVDSAPTVTRSGVSCYPNPFNPRTRLRFELATAGPAVLRLYDTRGRLVRRLVQEPLPAGRHEVPWDGRDDAGRACAAGLYLARLEAGGAVQTGRLVLVR